MTSSVQSHGSALEAPPRDPPEVLERLDAHLGLVDKTASYLARRASRNDLLEDFVGAGREGLLQAARSWRPGGAPFEVFARIRVRGAIIDHMRQTSPLSRALARELKATQVTNELSAVEAEYAPSSDREPDSARAESLIERHLANMVTAFELAADSTPPDESPEAQLDRAQTHSKLNELVDTLDADEAALIRAYYFEDRPLAEVGRELGLSRFWACRRHRDALKRLRKQLAASAEERAG